MEIFAYGHTCLILPVGQTVSWTPLTFDFITGKILNSCITDRSNIQVSSIMRFILFGFIFEERLEISVLPVIPESLANNVF